MGLAKRIRDEKENEPLTFKQKNGYHRQPFR